MNAVGYVRISTKDQSQYSIDYQQRLIKEYCDRNGLTLVNVFTDDGESSYTFDRPDFKALEAFIKASKNVEYLIIFDHDRFSRNLAEALIKIKELHDKFKIKVLATSDNFDTDFSDPSTFLLRAFKYMMAENELHRIRQRTKTGLTQAALQGRHVNKAPYGYLNARDENGKPILKQDDEKAFIVRAIFKEYLAGSEIEQVRSIVKNYGYDQKGRSTIQRILANPVYAGFVKMPGTKKISKGIHAAIISEHDYWLVQERLNKKHIVTQNSDEVYLRGALRCFCGRLVTAGNSKGKLGKYYWYYLCKEHKNNLPAVKLHNQFNEILETLSFDKETLEWLRVNLSKGIGKFLSEKADKAQKAISDLKKVQNKVKATEERYLLHPEMSEVSYRKVMSELKASEMKLQQEIASLNTNQQVYWDRLNSLLPKLSNLKVSFDKMEINKKHQFINMVFDRSLYHDGKTYRTPFLHDLFASNELILNKKGLLIKDNPLLNLSESLNRRVSETAVEPDTMETMTTLMQIFAA
jgi:site-specific DNA recombinase